MKHTHKYLRTDIGVAQPYIVWRCVLPGCNHYIPHKFIYGKVCICWRCGKEMIIKTSRPQMKPCCCKKNSVSVIKPEDMQEFVKRIVG